MTLTELAQRIADQRAIVALVGPSFSLIIWLDDAEWFSLLDDPIIAEPLEYMMRMANGELRAFIIEGATVRRA